MSRVIQARTRASIVRELREGKKLAQIARKHDVSASAVKSIRIAAGLQPIPTDAEKIRAAKARDVMLVDARRRRAQLMVDLLSDAERLRAQLWQPAKVFAFGRDSDGVHAYVDHPLSEPDAKAKQAIMITAAIAIDKSLALEKHDMEGAAAAKAAIIELVDRLSLPEIAS